MGFEIKIVQGRKGIYNGQLYNAAGAPLTNIQAGSYVEIKIGRREGSVPELDITNSATPGGSSTVLTTATGAYTLTIGATDSQGLQDGAHDVQVILIDAGDSNAPKQADYGVLDVISGLSGTNQNINNDICSIAEILVDLGISATYTDQQLGMVMRAKKKAESAVRSFLGYNVTQREYVGVLLPDANLFYSQADYIDVVNNRLSLWGWSDTSIAQVQELPVRSVNSLYADFSALAGQGAQDFGSSTLLVQGTDYYLDWDIVTDPTPNAKNGVSFSGHVVRWISAWPARRRSIKIDYVAGFTAAELDGKSGTNWMHYKDPSQIKEATIETAVAKFRQMEAFQDQNVKGVGAITSERLGDFAATYSGSIDSVIGMQTDLPPMVQYKLQAFKRMSTR